MRVARHLALALAALIALWLSAPAQAGYQVTLDGEDVTAVADDTHDTGFDDLVHISEREPYPALPESDIRRWVLWPVTGIDSDLLDGDPESENCRWFNHNFGSGGSDGAKCLLITSLDVTGGPDGDRVGAYTEYDATLNLPVTARLRGGDDAVSLGDDLTGPHDFAGGAGTDFLQLPQGSDWNVDLGSDSVSGGPAVSISSFENLQIDGFFGESDTVVVNGSDGPNEIDTSAAQSTIDGRAGDDEIDAIAGTNSVYGGPGADNLSVGFFSDPGETQYAEGGDGNDSIHIWGEDISTAHGGPGDDSVHGSSAGVNTVTGGPGDDLVSISNFTGVGGNAGGGAGTDQVFGGPGPDQLDGGTGTGDEVRGRGGADTITVDPTAGDTYLVGDWDEPGREPDDPPGADTITGSNGADVISGGAFADTIDAKGGDDWVYGDNSTTDPAWDPRGGDEIDGGAGDDLIFGREGDDIITGGPGADYIDCGPGTDQVTDQEPEDTLVDCEGVQTLNVSLGGDALGGDYVELDLTLASTDDGAIADLSYPGGAGASGFGILFSTDPYPLEDRGALGTASGPVPALPAGLGPASTSSHTYLLQATQPGFVAVRAEAEGTNDQDEQVSDADAVEVEIANRDIPDEEMFLEFAGGWARILSDLRNSFDARYSRVIKTINRAVRRWGPRRFARSARRTTSLERGFAARVGLPDHGLTWLPGNLKQAARLYAAFQRGKNSEAWKTFKARAGESFDFVVRTPFEFWSNQLWGSGPEGQVDVGRELIAGAEDLSGPTPGSLLSISRRLIYEEDDRPLALEDLRQLPEEVSEDLQHAATGAVQIQRTQAKRFVRKLNRNPEKAFEDLGRIPGRMQGEIGYIAAETMLTANALKIPGVLGRVKNAALAARTSEVATLESRATLEALVAKGGKQAVPPTAAELGMSATDQRTVSRIAGQLEDKAARLGYEGVEVEMSFRPRNPHSERVRGIGKNQFIKGSSGTELDVALGMDKSGLGKWAIYRPKLPPWFKSASADLQKALRETYRDAMKLYRKWNGRIHDPDIRELRKAVKPGGHTFRATLEDGTVTQTIRMELDAVERGRTMTFRYRRLTVDGRRVVRAGQRPKWVKSDYDGHAIIKSGGENLPASIRGSLELEAKHLLTEAAVRKGFAYGFHGFTFNGFDLAARDYRHVVKYVLMHMEEPAARQAAVKWAARYATDPEEFLKKLSFGEYLIKVTSKGAGTGFGP